VKNQVPRRGNDGFARRRARWLLAALLLAMVRPVLAAELYRCEDSGGVRFTSNPGSCPGARRHEVRGQVQTVPSHTPSAAPAFSAPVAVEAEESVWRRKRHEAQLELEAMRERVSRFEDLVGWCNRGGSLALKDETGLRQAVSCDEASKERNRARARVARLEAYLAEGLEDECRRAGCLPGWIR
jgi:hypothetical protein